MQKITSAIIISLGLIISSSIIVNGMEKNKTLGRYQLFQGKIRENYFTKKPDGTGIDSTSMEDCVLRIDTKTGEVDRYEMTISDRKSIQNKKGFYRVNY